MDIIIKTGFENIIHDIQFQPETIPKGIALFSSHHVVNVEEHRRNGKSLLIQAQVIRQTSVQATPYNTKLNIDAHRKVVGVSCTCVYNQSGKCKHIAALIHYINHEESLSKTDYEQQWGKPSERQLVQEKYSKGKYFCEMFPSKLNVLVSQCTEVDISELDEPSGLKTILLESKKNKNEKAVKILMESMLKTVDVMHKQEECAVYLNKFFDLCTKKPVYTKTQIMTEEMQSFYEKEIVLSRNNIIQLCCDTLEQSKCHDWFEARSVRVSASRNVHDIKSRVKKPVQKLVSDMLFPRKIDTPALRYGTENEPNAAKEYERLYSTAVNKVGVIISEKQPWLCASLDGIIVENHSIIRIVEFKCPSRCEKLPIVDVHEKKCNVPYLKFEGSTVILKESSVYYTQCQIQLYVTGLDICDLFVYSPVKNGSICIPLHRNEKFLEKVISKCEDFYFQYYLPHLSEKTKKAKGLQNQPSIKINQAETRHFTGLNIVNISEI